MLPATLALIVHAYPGERDRANAIGIWSAAHHRRRAHAYTQLLPPLLMLGVGLGLLTTPLVSAAVAAVPRERASLAGGVSNTAR